MSELVQTTNVSSIYGKTAICVKLEKVIFNYSVKVFLKTGIDVYEEMLPVNPMVLNPDKILTILQPGDYRFEIYAEKWSCCKCP